MSEFTLSQLNALNAAIVSGRLEVSYDGRLIKYQSTDAMLKARAIIRDDLIANGLLPAPANTNRGPASLSYFNRE